MQLVLSALSRNPPPELEVVSVLSWHKTVAELYLEFAQLSEVVAPLRVMSSLIISSFKIRCIETWLVLVLALAISSLMRPLLDLLFFALAHGECCCHYTVLCEADTYRRRVSMENGE